MRDRKIRRFRWTVRARRRAEVHCERSTKRRKFAPATISATLMGCDMGERLASGIFVRLLHVAVFPFASSRL